MNLSFRRTDSERLPQAVNLDTLEEELKSTAIATQYAPRQQLADIDRAVKVITSFSALPTKEIDETILALEQELADLKEDAQRVRNAYVEVSDRLMKHLERQKAVHKIANTAFAAMRQQCAALDQGELPLDPPVAEPGAA